MGLACCAIEMMAFVGPKYDVSRFGSEVFRFSPRQSDVMIVAVGRLTKCRTLSAEFGIKCGSKVVYCYGCLCIYGWYAPCYGVVQGVDNFLPVDAYISGCPPRPDAVIHALMKIQDKIKTEHSVLLDT